MKYIYNISDAIFIRPPGSCPGVGLGGTMGVGGQNFFPAIQPDLVCELLTWMTHAPAHFFGFPPLGPWGGVKKSNFLNMVMWDIKLKDMSSRPGLTEQFLPTIKVVTLRWGQRVNYHYISLRAWGFAMAHHRMCFSLWFLFRKFVKCWKIPYEIMKN